MRVEQRLSELLDGAAPPSQAVPFDAVARRVHRRRTARWAVMASAATIAAVVAGVVVAVTGTQGDGNGSRVATKPTLASKPPGDLVALTRQVRCPQQPTTVTASRLAAFHAVTVVTCGQEPRDLPGEGQWLVDVRRVATGGVAALQAAYGRPDERQAANACTDELITTWSLVLVDGEGRTLTPRAPVDGCHKPQRQFLAAVGAVSWQDVSVRKVRQVVTPQAQASGCPQQFKNMTFVSSQMGAAQSSGGPLYMARPTTVRVCEYTVTGRDFGVGTFADGFVLSAADTSRLLDALTRPGTSGSCAPQRKFAAVLTNGQWATVELGGCWRVARSYPSSQMGSADAAGVNAVLGRH